MVERNFSLCYDGVVEKQKGSNAMQDIYEYLRYTANLIAASEFGNQLVLKGGSVLIYKLIECNRLDLYRLTTDLDIHCDKKEVWIAFYTNIENILNNNDRNYIYKIEI